MKTRTTWREKLERGRPSKVVPVPPRMQARYGKGTLLIPNPMDVDALVRSVPRGRLITQSELRSALAEQAGADHACALVTGILIRISAEAAAEDERAGKKRVTPYWRVVRDDGRLLDKLPGGPEEQARRLSGEGHQVLRKGKQLLVQTGMPRS